MNKKREEKMNEHVRDSRRATGNGVFHALQEKAFDKIQTLSGEVVYWQTVGGLLLKGAMKLVLSVGTSMSEVGMELNRASMRHSSAIFSNLLANPISHHPCIHPEARPTGPARTSRVACMLIRGADHEIQTKRIDLPREIEMTLDDEQSLDSFTLAEISRRVTSDFERTHNGKLKLCEIQTTSSRNSRLVQLADLVAGAINRKLNYKGERNYKDDMAERIIHDLDLTLNSEEVPGLDATALFNV